MSDYFNDPNMFQNNQPQDMQSPMGPQGMTPAPQGMIPMGIGARNTLGQQRRFNPQRFERMQNRMERFQDRGRDIPQGFQNRYDQMLAMQQQFAPQSQPMPPQQPTMGMMPQGMPMSFGEGLSQNALAGMNPDQFAASVYTPQGMPQGDTFANNPDRPQMPMNQVLSGLFGQRSFNMPGPSESPQTVTGDYANKMMQAQGLRDMNIVKPLPAPPVPQQQAQQTQTQQAGISSLGNKPQGGGGLF